MTKPIPMYDPIRVVDAGNKGCVALFARFWSWVQRAWWWLRLLILLAAVWSCGWVSRGWLVNN